MLRLAQSPEPCAIAVQPASDSGLAGRLRSRSNSSPGRGGSGTPSQAASDLDHDCQWLTGSLGSGSVPGEPSLSQVQGLLPGPDSESELGLSHRAVTGTWHAESQAELEPESQADTASGRGGGAGRRIAGDKAYCLARTRTRSPG